MKTKKKKPKPQVAYMLVAKPSKPDFSEKAIDKMMGKKTKNKKKPKPMKKPKPHKDLRHLTMVLKYTIRNIKNDGSDLDNCFKEQAEKVRKQIEGLG